MNIKILCRTVNNKVKRLNSLLKDYGKIEIIAHDGIELKEYSGMTKMPNFKTITVTSIDQLNELVKDLNPFLKIPKQNGRVVFPFDLYISGTTAWDLAFKDIEIEDTLFIEDDVATNHSFLEPFFKFLGSEGSGYDFIGAEIEKKIESNWWPHWDYFKTISIEDKKSFNPFCFMKKSLVKKILDFKEERGGFCFHEIMFPTLAECSYDLKLNKQFNLLFYRPQLQGIIYTPYIYRALVHPVKDDIEHKKICDNTGEEVEIIIK